YVQVGQVERLAARERDGGLLDPEEVVRHPGVRLLDLVEEKDAAARGPQALDLRPQQAARPRGRPEKQRHTLLRRELRRVDPGDRLSPEQMPARLRDGPGLA